MSVLVHVKSTYLNVMVTKESSFDGKDGKTL